MNEKDEKYLKRVNEDMDIERQARKRFLIKYSYIEGIKEGITRYAWWKDGEQYVGTTGKTLKEALKELDQEFECKEVERIIGLQ